MPDPLHPRERAYTDESDQPLRAAVYARTSSPSQHHGYSLGEQTQRCLDRCEALDWIVAFVYQDDAESGADTDRPEFQQMLEMAQAQAFDVIVFWKLDRFSRSLIHAVQLETDLREMGISLYSVTEQIDTTSPTGRFNFRNLASAAEFERDMIKQRTQIGFAAMAEDHRWPNDNPPLGYSVTESGHLTVDDDERDLVTDIFELYLEERSMPTVTDRLNRRGVQTAAGGEWTPRAVGDILRNEIYRGQYELADVSEHVPEYQIVDDETFERVTEIRHRFQQDGATRPSMPTERKERLVSEMYERYREYLGLDTSSS